MNVWNSLLRRTHPGNAQAGLRSWAEHYLLVREWLGGVSSARALTSDQERRIVAEGWAQLRCIAFNQPHLVVAISLTSLTDVDALSKTFCALLLEEPSLRTTFHSQLSSPEEHRDAFLGLVTEPWRDVGKYYYRRDSEQAALDVREVYVDTQECSPFDEGLFKVIRSEAAKPFQINDAPLMRAVLLTNAAGAQILVIVVDRLIGDWRSVNIIQANVSGQRSASAPSRAHAAASQCTRVSDKEYLRCMSFWTKRWTMSSPLSQYDMPDAFPDHLIQGPFACLAATLEADVERRLRDWCKSSGVSGETILFSAFVSALHQATRRVCLTLWSEFRPLWLADCGWEVGPLSHKHIVTVDTTGTHSLSQFIDEVRRSVECSRQHASVPVELVWRALTQSRLKSPEVGSQVCCVYIRVATTDGRDRRPDAKVWPMLDTDILFGLQCLLVEDQESSRIVMSYDKGRYSRRMIQELMSHVMLFVSVVAAGGSGDRWPILR